MRLLLDTNALIWVRRDDPALDRRARRAIANAANPVFVSAASVWELAAKHNAGKLSLPIDSLLDELAERFTLLSITPQHALAAGQLPLHHRDPFDRMLVAQAQLEGLTLVTRDRELTRYRVAILPA